ncbi:hypothetical protein SAMN05421774_11230 [Gemmobacter megaterium]|uniref:Uncharacterized protein n=1 Tax=Gemmobacter megaterium TaxID=1086013 RepID=A0A1N7QIB8_9RHOB|nr:hypothetical protein GCM10011345_35970 [Gemmobacter megaterium]SIT22622.1 hypothetical protein SAMN05421774_11230 [Gemmobacter megaterium]
MPTLRIHEAYPDEVWFDAPESGAKTCRLCVAFVMWAQDDDDDPTRAARGYHDPVTGWLADQRGFWLLVGDERPGQAIWMQRLTILKGRVIFRSDEWPPGRRPEPDAEVRVRLLSLHRRAGP